jgi:ketosteroid isomerase-like protein
MTDTAIMARLAALEARLRTVEDEQAICRLIASFGPAVDRRSAPDTAALWAHDGLYDFGGDPLRGAEAVGALVDLPTHAAFVEAGCAHVLSSPRVSIDGDAATAVNTSRVYVRRGGHWQVERVSANLWVLRRTAEGWRVVRRVNRLLDGSAPARVLLAGCGHVP